MSITAEKSIIRRASGLLSNISSPFANHRASFLLDTSEPSEDSEEMAKWSTRGQRAKSVSNGPAQILIQTFHEVHTSSAHNSPRKDIRIVTSQKALMASSKSKAAAQSLLTPHAYHYTKSSSSAKSSSQGYSVASQRLSSSSRSMDQLIMGDDLKDLLESSDFQAAFTCPLNLSPILDEPNSPESESDETFLFSPRQRSKSLQPYAVSSRMERSIETTSSIGYNLELPHESTDSPYWKAPQEKRLSQEDYASWIRFENPVDLLSPTPSSHMTSSSVFSSYSFDTREVQPEDRPLEAYAMTREETQSYMGDSPIEATFCMHSHSDLGSSSQNFGALSSAGLFLSPSNARPLSPFLDAPLAHHIPASSHKSLRKKISQSFKDAFGKSAQNV